METRVRIDDFRVGGAQGERRVGAGEREGAREGGRREKREKEREKSRCCRKRQLESVARLV